VTSEPITRGHPNRPLLPMMLTPASPWPQHTRLGLPQRHGPLHPLTSCPGLGIGVSCQALRLQPCLPRAHQVALARAGISRHVWQKGSLGNTSCHSGGLQGKVPRVSPHPGTAGQPSGLP